MVEGGHVFRRAFSWLPAQFASQSDAPVGAPRQFGSTEHLSSEAIAAFVDGELRMNAHLRAAHHLSLCGDCAAEVDAHIRGLSPFPGAWFEASGPQGPVRVKALMSQLADGSGAPGEALDDRLRVACGEGAVRLVRVQREGKAAQSPEEMLRGFPLPAGTRLA